MQKIWIYNILNLSGELLLKPVATLFLFLHYESEELTRIHFPNSNITADYVDTGNDCRGVDNQLPDGTIYHSRDADIGELIQTFF